MARVQIPDDATAWAAVLKRDPLADGALGGYRWGLPRKAELLQRERRSKKA
ncbi:MAG TPA: hypothetical protein VF994_07760 [Myxococcales bacterium]